MDIHWVKILTPNDEGIGPDVVLYERLFTGKYAGIAALAEVEHLERTVTEIRNSSDPKQALYTNWSKEWRIESCIVEASEWIRDTIIPAKELLDEIYHR